jgi:hypothetical protein
MQKELSYIKNKNLSERETLIFYIDIGNSPIQALDNMGYEIKIPYENLCKCIKILNEGWWPDFENESQYKYWNYFKLKGGFSSWNTTYNDTLTDVPSALCLKDEETAKLAKTILFDLYEEVYTQKPLIKT